MDPPRIKSYKKEKNNHTKEGSFSGFSALFYCSIVILALVSALTLVYAYVLQVRYKSEKFRCDTPFFHKRDEAVVHENGSN